MFWNMFSFWNFWNPMKFAKFFIWANKQPNNHAYNHSYPTVTTRVAPLVEAARLKIKSRYISFNCRSHVFYSKEEFSHYFPPFHNFWKKLPIYILMIEIHLQMIVLILLLLCKSFLPTVRRESLGYCIQSHRSWKKLLQKHAAMTILAVWI